MSRSKRNRTKRLAARVAEAFDRDALALVCEMDEMEFADAYDLTTYKIDNGRPYADYFHYRDHGSDILSVAHLDTVQPEYNRDAHFLHTGGGEVVYSGALDDRLGAYVLLELLPKLGIQHDILLTVGEESGCSTAQHFDTSKPYNWMIEFDRGGTDVVMYDYEDDDNVRLVRQSGARVGQGIFTDICYLEDLGIKGFNWGVGYEDYHGPRSHAYLDDLFIMVAYYLRFHATNSKVAMPHEKKPHRPFSYLGGGYTRSWDWDDDKWDDDRRLANDAVVEAEQVLDSEPTDEELSDLDRGDPEPNRWWEDGEVAGIGINK